MSRRSHRHGDRGHGRPMRLEPGHALHPTPPPGPVEALGAPGRPAPEGPAPERPAPVIVARPTLPPHDRAEIRPLPDGDYAGDRVQPAMTNGHVPAPLNGSMAGGPHPPLNGAPTDGGMAGDQLRSAGCTSPQLRRFIKSRAYIPMHELRRRFAINGPEDDVAAIDVDGTRLYVGLPEREGRLLGELLRGGDVGAELSHDPVTPIIVGVYPMRPVPRS